MRLGRIGAMLFTILIAGCGFFSRAKIEHYSLDTLRSEAAPRAIGGTPIGVDGVELPPGIDRNTVVVRNDQHRFDVRGTHLWASPLEEMVIHTLAFDLAHRLPQGMVVLPGQAKPGAGAMRSLYVTFEDLAAGPGNVFVLEARWTLTAPATPEVSRAERITIDMPSSDSAAIADAMSRALATLADRIVGTL